MIINKIFIINTSENELKIKTTKISRSCLSHIYSLKLIKQTSTKSRPKTIILIRVFHKEKTTHPFLI